MDWSYEFLSTVVLAVEFYAKLVVLIELYVFFEFICIAFFFFFGESVFISCSKRR